MMLVADLIIYQDRKVVFQEIKGIILITQDLIAETAKKISIFFNALPRIRNEIKFLITYLIKMI